MKKVLLATTGLVGAALVASAASADSHTTPKVTVGGFIDFQAGFLSDDLDGAQRSHGFRNDTEISFQIDGKSASGLGYGAVIDLEADVSGDQQGDLNNASAADDEGVNAARTYIYLEDSWGRFELGSNEGVANTMAVDADDIAAGTGGINGDSLFFLNAPVNGLTGAGEGFITRAANVTEHGSSAVVGDETFDNANKITYYSPSISGLQLGVSYSPDSADRGQIVTLTDRAAGFGELFEVAGNYSMNWDAASLDLGATYQMGSADSTSGVEDVDAYTVGGILGFAGFEFAASYGDWSDSLNAAGLDSDYYSLGLGYDMGSFGVSATYLDSNVEAAGGDNEFENLVLGADYALAPGLTPYAEVSFFEFDGSASNTTADDNEGTVFLLGTQLAF